MASNSTLACYQLSYIGKGLINVSASSTLAARPDGPKLDSAFAIKASSRLAKSSFEHFDRPEPRK